MQHREPWRAQLAGVRDERDGAEREDTEFGQRGADQDVAGRDGVGVGHHFRRHRHGERAELHDRRPVLLPEQAVPEPDVGGVGDGRGLQQHQGHVRRAERAGALRLQRHGGLHQHHDVGGGAAATRGGDGGRSLLLERLRGVGDAHHSAHLLLAGRAAAVAGAAG